MARQREFASGDRRCAYVQKARFELAALADRGVVMAGNAFSQVLLVKGELVPGELAGGLLTGPDGEALRKALVALGYAPEDWAALATVAADGTPLRPALLRTAVAALGASTLIACDDAAALALRDAYGDELAGLEDADVALLRPGLVAPVLGMRVINLGGFAQALADPKRKQFAWACLKRVPPLGEPY